MGYYKVIVVWNKLEYKKNYADSLGEALQYITDHPELSKPDGIFLE